MSKYDSPDAPIVLLAELFQQELAEVTFPGVDRELVDAAVRGQAEARARVDAAEAACADARAELERAQASVQALTQRALAYLKIYAAEDAELSRKLEALAPKPRAAKRGRRRKDAVKVVAGKPASTEQDVARAS